MSYQSFRMRNRYHYVLATERTVKSKKPVGLHDFCLKVDSVVVHEIVSEHKLDVVAIDKFYSNYLSV
jgi:hypothetical protein